MKLFKKATIYILTRICLKRFDLGLYILFCLAAFCFICPVMAQESKEKIHQNRINIGQSVPDIAISGIHNYRDANSKPATVAKISDFKGKLLILDFWATWCSPCVAMIPKMDSLQRAFGDKVQFLSVTYQTEKEVLPFLEKYEKQQGKFYDLPNVFGDKKLHELFPHRELPHYVLIDKEGKLLSITSASEISKENILKALTSDGFNMEQKTDVIAKYDRKEPLFSYPAFRKNVVLQSNISGFVEGIAGGMSQNVYRDDVVPRITAINISMSRLYAIAFGRGTEIIGKNRIVFKVADSSNLKTDKKGIEFKAWQKTNAFCYELIVPPTIKDKAWDYMQQDLDRFFYKYKVTFAKHKTKCYVLSRTSMLDKISSKSSLTDQSIAVINRDGASLKNVYLKRFINELNLVYQQYSPYPFVDDTGLLATVDFEIKANLSKIEDLNKALAIYDLKFIEAVREVELLVVEDKL